MNYFANVRLNTVSIEETKDFLSSLKLEEIAHDFFVLATGFIGKVILALIIWIIGKRLVKTGVKLIGKALGKTELEVGVIKFLQSLLKFAAYLILLIAVIDILGIQTSSLIAIIGSAGLAAGLALQGSLSNFAGGILILVFKPFKVDDYIVALGNEGKVVTIDLLYTKLLTADNKTIMMPNGGLANANIVNVGEQNVRRIDIEIGIAYGTDIEKARTLLTEILKSHPGILKEEGIDVIVKRLDESCITLETRAWAASSDYGSVRSGLLEQYNNIFEEKGIQIPFNQLAVHIQENR